MSPYPHRASKPKHPTKLSTSLYREASRSWQQHRPRFAPADTIVQASLSSAPAQFAPASRYRVYNREAERVLPVGLAPEGGLQVRTILASRTISALFPEIHSIGGVRPDALRWHPDGLALDVMIPNPSSAEGIALGNRIVSFALENAKRFGLQDASGAACTTRPAAREPAATATMTTSTSPRPVADIPPAMRSTPAEPAKHGRR